MANDSATALFEEKYRVVAVETRRLTIRGILSGEVLTITNSYPENCFSQEDFPLGKLISLTDPSTAPVH